MSYKVLTFVRRNGRRQRTSVTYHGTLNRAIRYAKDVSDRPGVSCAIRRMK